MISLQPDSKELPYLSPSEWRIFLVLSMQSPLSVKQISEELSRRHPDFGQGISTLSTLLQRLMANRYVVRGRSDTGVIVYKPIVALEPALQRHAERFLDDFTQHRRPVLESLLRIVKEALAHVPSERVPRKGTKTS